MKTMKEALVSAIAIFCITLIILVGLKLGHDGTNLLIGVTAIAGLAGYQVGKRPSTNTPKSPTDPKPPG